MLLWEWLMQSLSHPVITNMISWMSKVRASIFQGVRTYHFPFVYWSCSGQFSHATYLWRTVHCLPCDNSNEKCVFRSFIALSFPVCKEGKIARQITLLTAGIMGCQLHGLPPSLPTLALTLEPACYTHSIGYG